MKCRQCKKKILEDDDFTRVKLSYVHDGCMDDFISGAINKVQKKKRKDMASLNKTAKNLKYKKSVVSTQVIFNRSVRAFWADSKGMCTCITCGKKDHWQGATIESGHYKTVGARNDLRFNRKNVYPQCKFCNNYGGHDTQLFKVEVMKIIGKDCHDRMVKDRKQVKHDLVKIRKESREIIRDAGFEV